MLSTEDNIAYPESWSDFTPVLSTEDSTGQNNQNNVLRSAGSVGSREHSLCIQPGKGMHFCFLLCWESFNCYNFGTTGPIQVSFSERCTSPNEDFNQIENWKCRMFDFRLIPLDRITNIFDVSKLKKKKLQLDERYLCLWDIMVICINTQQYRMYSNAIVIDGVRAWRTFI